MTDTLACGEICMMLKKTAGHMIALLLLNLFAVSAYARPAYVTDSFEITMRTGPSTQNKIIAMLTSDTELEIIREADGWANVRTRDGKEGWVIRRFVSDQKPKGLIIEELEGKIDTISEACKEPAQIIERLESENRELDSSLAATSAELAKLKLDYASLRKDAANIVALREEYRQTALKLQTVTAEFKKVSAENETLRSSYNVQWFMAGAGVVGLSWLVGYVMGRAGRRRRKPSFYS